MSTETTTTTRKKMGVVQLTLLTMVNMMGSGIIMLPTKLAEVGTVSILSWLVTATGATLLAYAFAMAGRYSKRPGGMGGYSEYAFGKAGNFTANFTYFISLVIANIAIAISAVGYGLSFMSIDTSTMDKGPIIVGVLTIITLWLATVLNFGGANITGRISSFTIWGVILPVFFLCIFGWFWFSPDRWAGSWNPHNFGMFKAISMSISMTLWAFLGLESASANSDAVENPEKNVPRAVLWGTLGAAALYIISTNVISGIVDNELLANSDGPFGLVFSQIFNPFVGRIVLGLMVISCFGSLLGWQFTIAEVASSMAKVKMMPSIFSKLSKHGAPIMGMVIITIAQSLIALMTMSPSLSKQFEVLVNLAVVTNVMPYILSMASLAAMMYVEKVKGRNVGTTIAIAFIGGLYSLYALYAAGAVAFIGGCLVTFFGWLIFGLMVPRLMRVGEMAVEGDVPMSASSEALEKAGSSATA